MAEPILPTAIFEGQTGALADFDTSFAFHNNWIFSDGSRVYLPTDFGRAAVYYDSITGWPAVPNDGQPRIFISEQAGVAAPAAGRPGMEPGDLVAIPSTAVIPGGGGGGVTISGSGFGWVSLDDYAPGGTDDQKLDAAIADVTSNAYAFPPTIRMSNRQYTFATAGRDPKEGIFLVGPGYKFNGPEGSTNQDMNFKINLTFASQNNGIGWWHLTAAGHRRGFGLSDLCFYITSSTNHPSVITQSPSAGNFYAGCILGRNCTGLGLWSFIGYVNPFNDASTHGAVPASQLVAITNCEILGGGNINFHNYSTTVYVGGAGIFLMSEGGLIDATVGQHPGNGEYHIRLSTCEESRVGPAYITCQGPWGGILVEGPAYNNGSQNQGGPIEFSGTVIEGMLSVQPSYGNVYRQTGGIVNMFGVIIEYGMSNPGIVSEGRSVASTGIAMITGGYCSISGMSVDVSNGVSFSTPVVAVSGAAVVDVRRVSTIGRQNVGASYGGNGAWSQLPVVAVSGSTALVAGDRSVIGTGQFNGKHSIATLVAGTVTVSDTAIKTGSVIRVDHATLGGTPGALYISAKTASTSFAITSTSGSDTSVVEWEVVSY